MQAIKIIDISCQFYSTKPSRMCYCTAQLPSLDYQQTDQTHTHTHTHTTTSLTSDHNDEGKIVL